MDALDSETEVHSGVLYIFFETRELFNNLQILDVIFVIEPVGAVGAVDFWKLKFVIPGKIVHEAHDWNGLGLGQAFVVGLQGKDCQMY